MTEKAPQRHSGSAEKRVAWQENGDASAEFARTITVMGDFKKLRAWQEAHSFDIAMHKAFIGRRTDIAPGLRRQILKAASSIPDNLAEGCGFRSRRELAKYANQSYSSAKEVENDLIKCRDLDILPSTVAEDLLRQCDGVAGLCYSLTIVPPGA